MIKKIFISLLLLPVLLSCMQSKPIDDTPTERITTAILNLRDTLTSAPYGWRVIYFPRTDSLLYSDPKATIKPHEYPLPQSFFLYGGSFFTMKFGEKETLTTLADYDEKCCTTPVHSSYTIVHNSSTELIFSTHTYLHRLSDEAFRGSSRWTFVGHDLAGDLIFRSHHYAEPAREYICLQRIQEDNATQITRKAWENRKYFEDMHDARLWIHYGDKRLFTSDVSGFGDKGKRYFLFQATKKRHTDPSRYPEETYGLGSGYVGTDTGLTFRAGLRYSKQYIFYDFERVGDRFICELVTIYPRLSHRQVYVPKHLFPHGEPTGIVAEIYDNH